MRLSRRVRGRQFGGTPHDLRPKREQQPETEADRNRRRVKDWLRERDESDVPDWADEESA